MRGAGTQVRQFLEEGREVMIEVIKRDASRQAFNEQKLRRSIEPAAKEAKVSAQRIKQRHGGPSTERGDRSGLLRSRTGA